MTHISLTSFYILVSLALGERHGYAIMKQTDDDSHGRVKLGPSTLYTNISRMMEEGLIEETQRDASQEPNERHRRYFRLTPKGQSALNAEMNRLEEVVKLGQKQGWFHAVQSA
jgi:DNA-binding PadR family transcriptional regulator